MTAEEYSVEILLHFRNGQMQRLWKAVKCSNMLNPFLFLFRLPDKNFPFHPGTNSHLLHSDTQQRQILRPHCLKHISILSSIQTTQLTPKLLKVGGGGNGARLINSSACWESLNPVGVIYKREVHISNKHLSTWCSASKMEHIKGAGSEDS